MQKQPAPLIECGALEHSSGQKLPADALGHLQILRRLCGELLIEFEDGEDAGWHGLQPSTFTSLPSLARYQVSGLMPFCPTQPMAKPTHSFLLLNSASEIQVPTAPLAMLVIEADIGR